MPQQLEVSCDLNGYLMCTMLKDVVEVEMKIKTKWGKYTLLRDFHTMTEKYRPWERADKCTRIYSQRRTTCQTKTIDPQDSAGNTTSTYSGMYIPTGHSRGYSPRIFTNPNDSGDSDAEVMALKHPLDWDEDLIDLTQADNTTTKQNKNPLPSDWSDEENQCTGGKAEAQMEATPRQSPPGWASWRREGSLPLTEKEKSTAQENTEAPIDSNKTRNGAQKLTIEEARSLAEEELLAID